MIEENLIESTDDLVVIDVKGFPEWKIHAYPTGEFEIINTVSGDVINIVSDDFAIAVIIGVNRIASKRFKGNPNWKKL